MPEISLGGTGRPKDSYICAPGKGRWVSWRRADARARYCSPVPGRRRPLIPPPRQHLSRDPAFQRRKGCARGAAH